MTRMSIVSKFCFSTISLPYLLRKMTTYLVKNYNEVEFGENILLLSVLFLLKNIIFYCDLGCLCSPHIVMFMCSPYTYASLLVISKF